MQIKKDFIKEGAGNRPGYAMQPVHITIHDTGNPAAYADAEAHAAYLQTSTAANAPVAWHFTVDDRQVIQHLPTNESGWHAGDGNGPGNRSSIGIEICENADGNREKAEQLAIELVAHLLDEHKLPISAVVQHNRWSGKHCPRILRDKGWQRFIARVMAVRQPKPQELPTAGVIVNGQRIADGVIIDSKTYVPLRAIGNALGLQVGWDQASKTASLTGGK